MVPKFPLKLFHALTQTTAPVRWSLSQKLLSQWLDLLQKHLWGSFLCSRTQQSSLPWSHGFPGSLLIILCSCLIKLPPLLFVFTGKCQPYAQRLLRFVQGRVGVSALPEVFNVSEPSSADLCHALSSVCFAKQLSTTEVEHPCREVASALERLQRKKNRKKTNMYFCSSKLNKHIFNHTLL